jgi:hypothetical protein
MVLHDPLPAILQVSDNDRLSTGAAVLMYISIPALIFYLIEIPFYLTYRILWIGHTL